MRFRSPWQSRPFVAAVAVLRRLLRPLPGLEERFIAALVQGQNRRVRRFLAAAPPQSLLLIMPRCVKRTGCRADVQASLAECRACFQCPLGDVARLCDRCGVRALVAFRSHIAFALARSERPDLIVSTACHDRLIKALRSVPEVPALLTPLGAMSAPCRDATFDLDWLAAQLTAVGRPPLAADAATGPAALGCPAAGPAGSP